MDMRTAPKDTLDTLTEILLGLRLDGVEYGRCVAGVTLDATGDARINPIGDGFTCPVGGHVSVRATNERARPIMPGEVRPIAWRAS